MPTPAGFGVNFRNTLVRVLHSELERYSEESPYRSRCPVCKTGILMVSRHPQSFQLSPFDRCTFCAQGVIYEDTLIAGEEVLPLPPDFLEKVYEVVNATPNLAKA